MQKNKILFILILFMLSISLNTSAQTTQPSTAPNSSAKPIKKKKIKIDFEDEAVSGSYDVPDTMFMNSRRLIKYKELFNKRTNFIEEIDSNKGLFNEHQK